MSVSFYTPQMFVLLLLLPLVWRWLTNRTVSVSACLRMALAALAVVYLAGPVVGAPGKGSDLIVVVDRSASCAARVEAEFRELLPLVQSELGGDDRFAVVGFGREAYVEKGFGSSDAGSVPPDGNDAASNFGDALAFAAGMADPARRTAVLYVGDGQFTGEDPLASAVRERIGAYPFWYRRVAEGAGLEVAARELEAPGEVQPRSAWTVGFSLYANAPCVAEYSLVRNGAALAAGKVELKCGENRFHVRDADPDAEMLSYRLRVDAPGDGIRENNVATALVRVAGAPKVLHVSHSGEKAFLALCLEAAAIPVDAVRPEAFPRTPAELAPYSVVILENCRLSALPAESVGSLAGAIENGLLSLLVTGGPNSFGNGGYHRSVLDPLLPVEMELRNEVRRGNVAVAIALDRSGSMSVPAGAGRTKMDLANLGAAESIRLLSERDQAAVIAVDSQAHVIIPLVIADQPERLADLALSIQSMGGGIFTRTALVAAREELAKSNLSNRHVILFADASDAEEQEGCFEIVRELRGENIGVSVVAMGEPGDSDSDFLVELARAGGSEALFSRDAEGLPALFTQEIMRVSRRGFVEERVAPLRTGVPLPGVGGAAFPAVDGYNISFPREGSDVFLRLDDEFDTPILAMRNLGRTATAAALFEIEGEYSGGFPRWGEAADMLVSLVRRIAPGRSAEGVKAYARIRRGTASLEVEFDPEAAERLEWPELSVRWLGAGGKTVESPLRWTAPDRAEARAPLEWPGHYLPVVDVPGLGVATGTAVSVSYPAEFEPGNPAREEKLLRGLSDIAGGGEAVSTARMLASGKAAAKSERDASGPVLLIIIALFLLELSGRRLLWFK